MKINWPDDKEAAAVIGRNIRRLRLEKRMTQNELARAGSPNWTNTVISRWEAGKLVPRFDALVALTRALGCTIDELVSK